LLPAATPYSSAPALDAQLDCQSVPAMATLLLFGRARKADCLNSIAKPPVHSASMEAARGYLLIRSNTRQVRPLEDRRASVKSSTHEAIYW